ncbi:hypothetical protein [Methyloversatilis sp.]|uniref:hypothetical protein n=1 Tax=Methyloversatilis sp. TaxID=2569862 RepID=UPI003F6F8C52
MSHRKRIFLLSSAGALLLVLAPIFILGKNIELLATTTVPIGAEPTIDPATTRTVAVLEIGARVVVLSCEDLKHFFAPEVRLPDGRTGFVMGGQFELTKKTPSLTFDQPIVFSCP